MHHVGHGEDAQKRPRGGSGVGEAGDTLILCARVREEFATTLTIQKEKDEASGFALTGHLGWGANGGARALVATWTTRARTSTVAQDLREDPRNVEEAIYAERGCATG